MATLNPFNQEPTVHYILLPVTTCSSDKSFSTLRRVKTYLRSTTDRLNGLAKTLLNIHRDVRVDTASILAKLAEKPRRLPFRLQ